MKVRNIVFVILLWTLHQCERTLCDGDTNLTMGNFLQFKSHMTN